ncbi:hypothetical protein PVAND_004497 [Polypedilum vanderplanki]|uniref:Protein naked cuticle homolog n=1 Tax=Polypedilum vanderplanki TaxID=319348 RepID=A0A9J6BXD5_POLVA|nr:hypothetical protein PVAND_004497 [Polypedilum vanderplanki]
MAGNIVKWWRQFRQYKTVLHEYTTDSEELIHKAPSECSASTHDYLPIDVQQKSQIQQKQQQEQQQSQSQQKQHSSSSSNPVTKQIPKAQQPQQVVIKSSKNIKVKEFHGKDSNKNEEEALERLRKRHSISTTHHLEQLETNRVQFNQLSCDVSLDDTTVKKPQPIQFSFTLYDLDGHGHGKITKDDIASIVSTIYDSIGSVVVPHYGKKTINVKLTVSPDVKKQELQENSANNNDQKTSKKNITLIPRRRYKARVLLSDEENDEGSESDSENISPIVKLQNDIMHSTPKVYENFDNEKNNIYESINNLKCCNQSSTMENLYTKNLKQIGTYKNCQLINSNERLHIVENDDDLILKTKNHHNVPRKRIIRKQRSQKHKLSDRATAARARSLSVGDEWRKNQENQKCNKNCELNNSSNLRRHELIEIIRESMEKNKLCFQSNKKATNTDRINQGRQRSNTITCTNKMTTVEVEKCLAEKCTAELDQHHLCAFDSFLHATVCSKLSNNHSNNQTKAKHMNQTIPTGLKLKTSLLNQLNPNLTSEQRLARKLNDVEKWMRETAIHEAKIKANDEKNILSPINVDKLSTNVTSARHKKPFDKEILITKKSKSSSPHRSKQQKDAINNIKNQAVLEILGDTSECENLISMSDEDEVEQTAAVDVNNKTELPVQERSEDASKSSSVRFVHIHHHFYHFENNAKSS